MSALVLLPGMNCSADLWAGCGLEGALTPPLDRPSVAEQVEVLLGVLPPRFVLGGLSLGAVVAAELALRAPERVTALVLTAVNGRAPTAAQRRSWARWRARLREGATARVLQEEILTSLLPPDVAATRPDLVARTLAMCCEEPVLDRQLSLQDSRADLLGRLPGLTVPTLVVSGERDAICPPEFHTAIAGAVPGARLASLPAGHLVPLEEPGRFGDLVRSFVRGGPQAAVSSAR
ncbi:alpha/beta fold hydrolase [Kineococcus rhizosphaerae]|uniref:Pimeloyl-ACP methyl ester carboxylesterase n=1 Tax=Kineococcus rhizosphaerae TaxID=559628 RepID=A0A2T0QXU5_9ACTN|nr:alpha/beta fold hydrolase [Kineococcus rhizosphaerae]PRY10845.1 pimeloyl-ACP methyl ester carboxylesterase [Kineococcus rhizosphaerae]